MLHEFWDNHRSLHEANHKSEKKRSLIIPDWKDLKWIILPAFFPRSTTFSECVIFSGWNHDDCRNDNTTQTTATPKLLYITTDERENGGKRMLGGKKKVEESLWLDEENEVMQGVVKHKRTRESWKKKWKWKNNEKENERKDYDASCFIKVYVIYTKRTLWIENSRVNDQRMSNK